MKHLFIFVVAAACLAGCGGLLGGTGGDDAVTTGGTTTGGTTTGGTTGFTTVETVIYENNFERYKNDADMNDPVTGWKYEALDPALNGAVTDIANPVRLGTTGPDLAAHEGSKYGVFYAFPSLSANFSSVKLRRLQDRSFNLSALANRTFDEVIFEMWVSTSRMSDAHYSIAMYLSSRYDFSDAVKIGIFPSGAVVDWDQQNHHYGGNEASWQRTAWNKVELIFDLGFPNAYPNDPSVNTPTTLRTNDKIAIGDTYMFDPPSLPYFIADGFGVSSLPDTPICMDGIRVIGVTKVRKG